MLPDHVPEALQELACALDHVRTELAPAASESGLADSVTLAGCAAVAPEPSLLQAPAKSARTSTTHRNGVAVNMFI